VRAAVRVRAVVQRVCSGVAPEAESPATIPGVREAVRWASLRKPRALGVSKMGQTSASSCAHC
jgi:hypothetical protein